MVNTCCNDMSSHLYLLDQKCVNNGGDENDKIVHYSSKYNEYGIPLVDGISYILIEFCPWCGKRLPKSLREEWFSQLEKIGYDSPLTQNDYPEIFKSWDWWLKK